MLVKTKALVLRGTVVGEQDRLLTMLSGDLGVIQVSLRGSGRSGSRLTAVAQPLMYGEYVLFRGRSRYSLNQGEVLASFYDLAMEPARYEMAARLLSLASEAGAAEESSQEVLALTLHTMHRLMPDSTLQPNLTVAVFLLKLLQISGLTPTLTGCALCGTQAIDQIRFSFQHAGFLCESCEPGATNTTPVSTGVAKAMLYTLCAPVPQVFKFSLEAELIEPFHQLVEKYARERWDLRMPNTASLYGQPNIAVSAETVSAAKVENAMTRTEPTGGGT